MWNPHRSRWRIAFVLLSACAAQAATLEVDSGGGTPFLTIQSAIDAAVPGQDEVMVRCGRYVENVVMVQGVSLRGQGAHCVTIDGNRNGLPAVLMPSLDPATVLEGFTITNGLADGGGGIRVEGGAPVITHNVITGNGVTLWTGYYYYGAGIAVLPDTDPDNGPLISYNVIENNTAFVGGGLDVNDAVVTSNLIVGNVASFGGGMQSGSSVLVRNNTFVFNQADYGGGIWGNDDDTILANNVFAWNVAAQGGDVFFPGPAPQFLHNNSWGNLPYQTYDPVMPGPGNISADPLFVDTEDRGFGGFQPRSDSPMIDAGSASFAPPRDLLGIPTPVDGDADGQGTIDIGARENEGLTRLVHNGSDFRWDAGNHQPRHYNVYRGDLAALAQSGLYTQDPATVTGARHFCGLTGPVLDDADRPASGRTFFYLPVALGATEGSLGFDGSRRARPGDLACQPS